MPFTITSATPETTNFTAAAGNQKKEPVYIVGFHGYLTATLSASMSATQLTMTLSGVPTGFPTSGFLNVDGEYIYFSGRSGGSVTITKSFGRAALASFAEAHPTGSTVTIVYAFCSGPVAGRESNTDMPNLLDPPDGLTQSMRMEDGTTEVGALNFTVTDRAEVVTALLTANSFAFRDKLVRFLVGFQDTQEADYIVAATMKIREIKVDSTLERYRFNCLDLMRALSVPVNFGSTTLSGALNNSATTVPCASTSGFSTSGSFLLDSEVVDYTAKTSTSFTGCTRGAQGSTADSHDDAAQISEVYVVQDNPIDILLRFMLTQDGTQVNSAYDRNDASKGLGLDQGLVDIQTFEELRDAYLSSHTYRFLLTRDDMANFKDWAEKQINQTVAGLFVMRGNGIISYRIAGPVVLTSDPMDLSPANIAGNPEWDLGATWVINDVIVKYDYDLVSGVFLQSLEQINATSLAKHGEGRQIVVESKGIRSTLDASGVIGRLFNFLDHRFSEPPPEARVTVHFSEISADPANGALLTHPDLPDLRRGVRGITSQQMEVSEQNPDFHAGTVKLLLRDINRSGKFGVIAPTLGLVDPASAFPAYTAASAAEQRYGYICVTATLLQSNGDPPTLII